MGDIEIDRDLIDNPPSNTTAEGYERLFDLHVRQSLNHFTRGLPSGGLSSLFKRKPSLDAGRASGAFEAAYRKLLTDSVIALPDGERMDGDPQSKVFRPVPLFLTEERALIVPARFAQPDGPSPANGSERDADTVASCFPYELVGTIDRILADTGLSPEQRRRACGAVCFGIAMDFDDGVLEGPSHGEAIAPILCYGTSGDSLVLLPCVAAQHEYVSGNVEEYIKAKSP